MLDIDMDRAHALRAAGWSYNRLAREFGCAVSTMRYRLNFGAAQDGRRRTATWRQANLEVARQGELARARKWRNENQEAYRARCRRWYAANPDYSRRTRLADLSTRFKSTVGAAKRKSLAGIPFEDVDLEALCERDGWTCQICLGPVDRQIMELHHPRGMSFDHIVPDSAGGGWVWGNLQLAHFGCNVMRGNRPLEEARAFAREFMIRMAVQP